MITGRVRVVKGRNSVFSLALNRTTSNEYKVYTSTFEEQVKIHVLLTVELAVCDHYDYMPQVKSFN